MKMSYVVSLYCHQLFTEEVIFYLLPTVVSECSDVDLPTHLWLVLSNVVHLLDLIKKSFKALFILLEL